jgi:predicted methyltransferase
MDQSEKRRRPRVRPGRLVTVRLVNQASVQDATVFDLSESGLGILVQSPIKSGTTVHVEVENHVLVGTVVSSQPWTEGQHRIGLELIHLIGSSAWEKLSGKLHRESFTAA